MSMELVAQHLTTWAIAIFVGLTISLVQGAPVLGPDLNTCKPLSFTELHIPVNCCLSTTVYPQKDFEFPRDLPMRVRRPFHKLDEFRIRQFEQGVALMKALPQDDPRSWYQQNQLHCVYACGTYEMVGGAEEGKTSRMSTHLNWTFLPFHAWYVYFVERIIAKLVGDDTFAMPYWAWDAFDVAKIPAAFMNESSSLWDFARLQHHLSPGIVNLAEYFDLQNHDDDFSTEAAHRKSNNYQMQQIFDKSLSPEAVYGGAYRAGDSVSYKSGAMELGPHLAVHFWVADINYKWGEDMGQSHTAANDPIFICHHSQVDRLWRLWQSRGLKDIDDPDFLNTQFFFYDENGEFVRVNISGAMDSEKMCVSYEEIEKAWLKDDAEVNSIRARGDVKYARVDKWRKAWRTLAEEVTWPSISNRLGWGTKVNGGLDLFVNGGVSTAWVSRPSSRAFSRFADSLDAPTEMLIVRGVITKPFYVTVSVRVFVELPEADSTTPLDCLESAGQIYIASDSIAQNSMDEEIVADREFEYRTGMGEKLKWLGINDLRSLRITFVSVWHPESDVDVMVKFTEIRMETQKVKTSE